MERRSLCAGALGGAAAGVVGAFAALLLAPRADAGSGILGAGQGAAETERLEWTDEHGRERREPIQRIALTVPSGHGDIVGFSDTGGTYTIWFRDQAGDLRNVVMPGDRLYRIARKP